jgi:thiol-disulfide isomerase/thioredoxin
MKGFCWVLGLLPLLSFGQEKKDTTFTITGDIKGLLDKKLVFLTDVSNPTDTVAKTQAMGGHFVMSGHIAEPNLYELNLGSAERKSPLFMSNDKISVNGSLDDLKGLSVQGSPTNDDFVEFQKEFNPYFVRINGVMQLANSPEGMKSKDSLFKVYKRIADSTMDRLDVFVANKRSSYVSPFVMVVLNQLSEDVGRQLKRYNSLTPEVQKGYYGQYLKSKLDEASIGAIGTDAMDFTQNDTAGRAVTLSSFKGKYVLVDFWASWCGPCRMENPNVVSMYKKFKGKNFTVLGVSLDKSKEPWIKAIKDDGLAWTQVSDLKYWYNEAALKYHVQSIPTNYLIDPSGKIVGRNLRGPDLQAKLCELLGCN